MNTFLIIIAIVVILLVILFIYSRYKMKNISDVQAHEKIITLTDANFTNQLKGKTVLVDFWADWCMPCKMMSPILNEVADSLKDDNNFKVGKLDVDKHQAMAKKYGIRSIPTMIIFKDGKEMQRLVGVKTKNALMNELKKA